MFDDIKCFFKDLIAKIKNKRFSAKTPFIISTCVILLLIPTLTAIWHVYFRAEDDFGSSSDIVISFYDMQQNKKLFFVEMNENSISDSHTANMFYGINSGKELLSAPSQSLSEPNFKLSVSTVNRSLEYLCYFSEDIAGSYLESEDGKLYSVDEKNYASFLSSSYSTAAYSNAIPPALFTENGASVTPKTVNWNFKKTDGVFNALSDPLTTSTEKTYQMYGTIKLSFSVEPSKCNVTVFECSENKLVQTEIYNGELSGLSTITAHSGARLLFWVDAVWLQADYEKFYGGLSYAFEVECTEHASFELSSSTVTQGEFITILLHGATDPSTVIYELLISDENENNIFNIDSQADLSEEQKGSVNFLKHFKPSFVNNGQDLCAFLPIPVDTPKGVFSFSLSSGIATKTFTVEITERNSGDQIELDTTLTEINDAVSKDSVDETKHILATITNDRAPNALFSTSFEHPLQNQNTVTYDFCDSFLISGTQTETLRSYGSFYTTSDSSFSSVTSIAIGKVSYVGYTKQLGNFAVVDHGMGLCSWYCNLSLVDVRQGDVIASGQIIGKTGNSPFTSKNGVLFICTIYGSVIDPNLIVNTQIKLGS